MAQSSTQASLASYGVVGLGPAATVGICCFGRLRTQEEVVAQQGEEDQKERGGQEELSQNW